MADRELAAKLARRRFNHGDVQTGNGEEYEGNPLFISPPLPPPPPPQVVHPNCLPSIECCIDDLINETLKYRQDQGFSPQQQQVQAVHDHHHPYQQQQQFSPQQQQVQAVHDHHHQYQQQQVQAVHDHHYQYQQPQVQAVHDHQQQQAMFINKSNMKMPTFTAPTIPIVHHSVESTSPAERLRAFNRQSERAERGEIELAQKLVLQRTKKQDATHSFSQSNGQSINMTHPYSSTSSSSDHSSTLSPPSSSFVSSSTDELSVKLQRRNLINEGEQVSSSPSTGGSLYAEFPELNRKQIKSIADTFRKYDENEDGFIDFNELKRMMEKLGEAQTHIALKDMIKQVDEDHDGMINMREFLSLFRLAASGQLICSQAFVKLAQTIDVTKEGVGGAAGFFQAKINALGQGSAFEMEMQEERKERKEQQETKKESQQRFRDNKAIFHQ